MASSSQLPGLEKPGWLTQMESVLEVLNEGVVIANDCHRVLFVNSRFAEMTGILKENLIGAESSQFYSLQEWDFLTKQADVAFREGHSSYAFVLPRKDGGRLPVVISSRTVQNEGNRYAIMTFTDISEQVRAEEELRSANTKLQERQMEIEEDLRLAAGIQKSLVPRPFVGDKVSIDPFYHPVHSIGGDFAVVNSQDCEGVSLLVCDVSGHGIGSALVANRIYSEMTAHMRSEMPFLEMFAELNRFLIEDICDSGMFVTAAAAHVDIRRGKLVFAGAGHPPAMLARRGQPPLLLESRGMILGVLPEAVDVGINVEVPLQPDDRLVLYTDGITEVFDSRGEMLGVEGVQEIVRHASSLPAQEMKKRILDGVTAWRHGPATDDVSLMVVHVR
jgi:PAS domain S-box-containing protein